MKCVYSVIVAGLCGLPAMERARAVTVDELGAGPSEVVTINVDGSGTLLVDAGVIKLDIGGLHTDAFCIDPFHFSDGLMSGYQVVGLTSAPKEHVMSANTALLLERLWGSYYSPGMSPADAAGLQIAFWELTGGSGFKLLSNNDYGASGFLASVEASTYDGPVADLVSLTGPGQDYAVDAASVDSLTVPETSQTFWLLGFSVLILGIGSWKAPQLAPVQTARR